MLNKILAMFTQTFGPIYGYYVITVIAQEKSRPQASGDPTADQTVFGSCGEMVYLTLVILPLLSGEI